MNLRRVTGALLLLSVGLLFACSRPSLDQTHLVGLSKAEVRQRLGEPQKITALVKQTEQVFGPVEAIWGQVQLGGKIETWTYEVSLGSKTLYFLPASDRVAVEFFWYHDPKRNPVY